MKRAASGIAQAAWRRLSTGVRLGALVAVLAAAPAWAQTSLADTARPTGADTTRPAADIDRRPVLPPLNSPSWLGPWRSLPRLGPEQRAADSLRRATAPPPLSDSARRAQRAARRDSLERAWPIPGRATRLSLLLPGLGQVYNAGIGRKGLTTSSKAFHLAKVPVIYGLMGLTVSLAISNDTRYETFKQAFIVKTFNASIADTVSNRAELLLPDAYPTASADAVRRQRDFFRRSRDQAIFWTVVIYALNGVEAFVSAHLRTFDVSDDLSLHIAPAIELQPPTALNPEPGLQLGARLSLRLGR